MPNDLLLGVIVSFVGYGLLTLTGINGIRHARLLGLGVDGYAMASVWLWIAISGTLNLIGTVSLVNAYGMPVAIKFDSGHLEPFTFGFRNWIVLSVGFVIVTGLCFRSFVMVRNAKTQTAEQRKVIADTQKAMLKLRRTLDA